MLLRELYGILKDGEFVDLIDEEEIAYEQSNALDNAVRALEDALSEEIVL